MVFEHFALNVPEPTSMALWYAQHLQMRIIRKMERAPYTHFLADQTGQVVMEIYSNRQALIPEYATQHPLCFHFAFAVTDAEAEKNDYSRPELRFLKTSTLKMALTLSCCAIPGGSLFRSVSERNR